MKANTLAVSRALIGVSIALIIFLLAGIIFNSFASSDSLEKGEETKQRLIRESYERMRKAKAELDRA